MNENIRLAIADLQEANKAAAAAQFNLREANTVYEAATEAEQKAMIMVRHMELVLTKAVRENPL